MAKHHICPHYSEASAGSTPRRNTSTLTGRLKVNLEKKCKITAGSRIVAAVSGGPDSVGLLHLLCAVKKEMRLHISVAHFDHQLRGKESCRDAKFVCDLAAGLGLAFQVGSGDVRELSTRKRISIQEAARSLRYEFLKKVLMETKSCRILTAHTADDQAEELLLRLIRGSSLAGLSGIPWTRDGWIARPILDFTKQEILDFLKGLDIPYVEDSSNRENKYLRNRVRHMVLPLLQKHFNPSIVRTLTTSAEVIWEDHVFLEKMAKDALQNSLIPGKDTGDITFNAYRLAGVPRALRRRVLRLALQRLDLPMGRTGSRHILALDSLLEKGKSRWEFRLPGRWNAVKKNEVLYFTKKTSRPANKAQLNEPKELLIERPGIWPAPSSQGHVEISTPENLTWDEIKNRDLFPRPLFLNKSKIRFPLTIRTRKPGERFWPLGGPRPYKLKEFLISRKISRDIRDQLPLLTCGEEVLAVLGIEVAHPYRMRSSGDMCLKVAWHIKDIC